MKECFEMNEQRQEPANAMRAGELWVDPGPPRSFAAPDTDTYLVVLGSGAVMPNPFRRGPGGAVIVKGRPFIIDAGEGIYRSIARAAIAHDGLLVDALAPRKIKNLFFTHLHSDHTVGLPSLLLLPWTIGKKDPFQIIGPPGTSNLVSKTLEAYRADIEQRSTGIESKDNVGWRADVIEVSDSGLVYEDDDVKIEAFHHPHGEWVPNFAYRFTTADRVIVWGGDGQASPGYLEAIRGADLLVSEICTVDHLAKAVWGGGDFEEKQRVIWSYHIKPRDLAEMASEANIKTLVLTHELNYSTPFDVDALLNEVKREYQGEVISSRDADVF
jgi:ribonuclease BN (tRNA processing enzyme)